MGDGIGQPAKVSNGVAEHDRLGGRQTDTGNLIRFSPVKTVHVSFSLLCVKKKEKESTCSSTGGHTADTHCACFSRRGRRRKLPNTFLVSGMCSCPPPPFAVASVGVSERRAIVLVGSGVDIFRPVSWALVQCDRNSTHTVRIERPLCCSDKKPWTSRGLNRPGESFRCAREGKKIQRRTTGENV